jgi:hypothetical protein
LFAARIRSQRKCYCVPDANFRTRF